MARTEVRRSVRAPRPRVFRALLDPEAIAVWKAPRGMSIQVHAFDGRVGGHVHVSLTYDAPGTAGKTREQTDTYRVGRGPRPARRPRGSGGVSRARRA